MINQDKICFLGRLTFSRDTDTRTGAGTGSLRRKCSEREETRGPAKGAALVWIFSVLALRHTVNPNQFNIHFKPKQISFRQIFRRGRLFEKAAFSASLRFGCW